MSELGPVCGMTWGWTGVRGTWATPAAESSLARMAELGVNWTAVTFAALQETAQSTRVRFQDPPTVTDEEVRWAIRAAQQAGTQVCLKPVVNCADGTWRAHIGFLEPDVPGEPTWAQWFASYRQFLLHYARIAEEEGCEMFSVGCEMVRADAHPRQWRALVAAVREVYGGLITYNCDKYQEDRVSWWDAVDVISSSGYYPLGSWPEQLDRIEAVVSRHGKPFVFLESGCPSREGSAARPNDWSLAGAPSQAEQARWYADMFAACASRDWVDGFVLWDWPAQLYPAAEAHRNDDYCVYGKSAAEVIATEYRSLAG